MNKLLESLWETFEWAGRISREDWEHIMTELIEKCVLKQPNDQE